MQRREFVARLTAIAVGGGYGAFSTGCRSQQHAHVLRPDQQDMVGTRSAGAETFNPLIDDAVAQLLGRHAEAIVPASHSSDPASDTRLAICFIGVENKSSEELGDFKDQIYEQIDTQIVQSSVFRPISRRYVETGLRQTRLRPDSLFVPSNRTVFATAMEQMGQPFDYLLYATITSGTTEANRSFQRDYLLTLEMVNIHTGDYDKQSAKVRKGYHRSRLGKLKHYFGRG